MNNKVITGVLLGLLGILLAVAAYLGIFLKVLGIIFALILLAAYAVIKFDLMEGSDEIKKMPWFQTTDHLLGGFVVYVLPWITVVYIILSWGISSLCEATMEEEDLLEYEWAISYVIWFLWAIAVAAMFVAGWFTVETERNKVKIYKGRFTGRVYTKWPGLSFTFVPLQEFKGGDEDIKDTAKDKDVSDTGDAETGGANPSDKVTMKYGFLIQWRPRINGNRDEDMRKFCLTTPDNIDKQLKAAAHLAMMSYLQAHNKQNVKDDQEDAITPQLPRLAKVAGDYGIEIVYAALNTFDFSDALRKSLEGQQRTKAIEDAVLSLMNGPLQLTKDQALAVVKGDQLPNYREINISGNSGGTTTMIQP
ncbi:MAG: hypothetical protein KGZ39_01845 [Simkania sp.]|nr:hypothetical protein [Simkania sp.]